MLTLHLHILDFPLRNAYLYNAYHHVEVHASVENDISDNS